MGLRKVSGAYKNSFSCGNAESHEMSTPLSMKFLVRSQSKVATSLVV